MELPSPGAFAVALAVSISCSVLVYAHAERHGNQRATLWGIIGFVFALAGAIAYFGVYLLNRRRVR